MLSSVLRSDKAVEVNISIMRTFVFIRQYALSHKDLTAQLKKQEEKYDLQFKDIHDAIRFLLNKDRKVTQQQTRKRIGFQKE